MSMTTSPLTTSGCSSAAIAAAFPPMLWPTSTASDSPCRNCQVGETNNRDCVISVKPPGAVKQQHTAEHLVSNEDSGCGIRDAREKNTAECPTHAPCYTKNTPTLPVEKAQA